MSTLEEAMNEGPRHVDGGGDEAVWSMSLELQGDGCDLIPALLPELPWLPPLGKGWKEKGSSGEEAGKRPV